MSKATAHPRKRGRPTTQPVAISGAPIPLLVAPVVSTTEGSDRQNAVSLARLAEGVWRIERRAKREVAAAAWIAPLLERVNDDLRDLGVEIIDRAGTRLGDGETLEVLHSEAPDGWARGLRVTEVISPQIKIAGVLIEHGKVVVGPDPAEAEKETTCQVK